MKKQLKSLLLVALLIGYVVPIYAQSSTEGKEFWVALLMANSPSGFSEGSFEPFIAISAKKQCKVTISNPSQGWTQATRTVNADDWLVIKDIPLDKWYDKTWTASNASEKITKFGIKVDATEDVSVYAAIRMEYSYDASNVLPVTALQSDYIIQDYPVYNSEGEAHADFVIVATEDNTTVAITPTAATQGGKQAGTRFTVDLKKGETYQVIGLDQQTFSGTRVTAYATTDHSAPKPIAVFQGADFTQVPGGKSARDCLYEQAMPLDYWGTEFVVTRSVEKDANRVRITAADNTTEVNIDGYSVKQLKPGETWEFEMSEDLASTEMASAITKIGREIPLILKGDAHYIKTSCPVAVYCYDVSSDYRFSTTEKLGDPSMVWISPLQQRISKITFGACGTSGSKGHTNRHYVNIVCLTSDVASIKLSSELRSNIPTSFQPVPGNPEYSYARVFLVDTDGSTVDKVYTLSSDNGVVAHVYGSGYNESYAYSVGSAAVKQGINVNGTIFTDGYRSDAKFCFGDEISFDANVGTDEIERVDWSFGDGTTMYYGPANTSHVYSSPGWYDVTAVLYGHQVCTDEAEQELGSVSFSFRIVRPDTVFGTIIPKCIDLADYNANPAYWDEKIANPEIEIVQEHCYDTVVLNYVIYNRETEETLDDIVGHDVAYGYNGKAYYASQDVVDTVPNPAGCNHYIKYYVKVITCLDITVKNDPAAQHACPGDNIAVTYTKTKGDIKGQGKLKIPGRSDQEIYISNENVRDASLTIPVDAITKPGIYKAQLLIEDENCGDTKSFDIDFTIYYPADIFAYKFNNVLAVYQKGYGGNSGYEFVGYQWYRNGVAIPDATNSIYHTDAPFTAGDVYYVELTDKNGMTLSSCSQEIKTVPDYNPQPNAAPAQKKLINNRIYIVIDERMYDAYGKRVQ